MINQKDIYVGLNLPSNNELLWARPQSNGSVVLSVKVNNSWIAANSESGSGLYYSKQEIDNRFADILGIDAEGIAALKALVEDGSALTGLLGEINDKLDKDAENIVTGSIKASVPGGYKLTNSAEMGVIMGNTNSTYSALTSAGIEFTNSTGGQQDALYLTGNKVNGRVKVGIFASPDLAYKDLAYTNDIPTSLALLSDDTTHRTVTDEDKTMWNYVSNQFKNALIEDHTSDGSISTASFTAEHSGTFLLQGTLSTTGRDIVLTFTIDRGELHTIVYREVITVTPSDPSATINIEQEVESGDKINWSTSIYAFDDLHGSITTCQINYIDLSTLASVAMSGSYSDLSNTPSIPEISTDISSDSDSNTKTTSPKAVKTFVEGKGYTTNAGTITGISMNNVSKGTSGSVDLGTVITGVKIGTTSLTPSSGVVTISTTDTPASLDTSLITSDGVYTALQDYETKLKFSSTTSTSFTAARNTYYRISVSVSSLSITLPSGNSLLAGDQCGFSFTTGSSITTPTITSGTIKKMDGWASMWSANTTYEIVALYDGSKWLVTATKFE